MFKTGPVIFLSCLSLILLVFLPSEVMEHLLDCPSWIPESNFDSHLFPRVPHLSVSLTLHALKYDHACAP